MTGAWSSDDAEGSLTLVAHSARLQGRKGLRKTNPYSEKHGPRAAETWPCGKAQAIGMEKSMVMGETALAQALATKFAAVFRECDSIASAQEVASKIDENLKKHKFTHRAIVISMGSRMCQLLARSWRDPDEAMEDLYRMHDLRLQALFVPSWRASKDAIVRALVMLCSGLRWRTSASHLHGPGESPHQALHVWIQQTYVFAHFAEAGFLDREGSREVENQLNVELKEILHRIPSSDLHRFAAYLRAGGGYILRGRAAVDNCVFMMPPDSIKPVAVKDELPPEVPNSVSVAAFDALRAAERAGGADEKAAPTVAGHLAQLGLLDPAIPISPLGRRPSRPASTSTLLPAPSPVPKKPGDRLSHHDILRRASALSIVRGHVGNDALPAPSLVRGEVVAGIGAMGHVGARSGAAFKGLAPVGAQGMSALQRALLQVHAAKPNAGKPEPLPRCASLPLVACGRPPPGMSRATS